MATFEISLDKIKVEVDTLNGYIKNYKDTISAVKNTLNNADSFWNDYNTNPFIKTITTDNTSFLNHINAISNYVNVIEQFCNELKQCIFKSTGNNRVTKIKYDSSNTNYAIQDLNNSILFLEKALASLEAMNVPITFKYRLILNLYEKQLKENIKTLKVSKETLENINRSINSILSNAKIKNAQVEFMTVDSKKLGYHWQTFSSDLKNVDDKSGNEHNVIGNNSNQSILNVDQVNVDSTNTIANGAVIELLDVDNPDVVIGPDANKTLNDNINIDGINITYNGDVENVSSTSLNQNMNNSNISYVGNDEKVNSNADNVNMNASNISFESADKLKDNITNANTSFVGIDTDIDFGDKKISETTNKSVLNNISYEVENDKKLNEINGIENLE